MGPRTGERPATTISTKTISSAARAVAANHRGALSRPVRAGRSGRLRQTGFGRGTRRVPRGTAVPSSGRRRARSSSPAPYPDRSRGIHAEAVGVRARHVDGLDAADRAEQVLRRSGIEGVDGERLAPLNSLKRAAGTIKCRQPDLLQIEQLHSQRRMRAGARTSKRTRPQ